MRAVLVLTLRESIGVDSDSVTLCVDRGVKLSLSDLFHSLHTNVELGATTAVLRWSVRSLPQLAELLNSPTRSMSISL